MTKKLDLMFLLGKPCLKISKDKQFTRDYLCTFPKKDGTGMMFTLQEIEEGIEFIFRGQKKFGMFDVHETPDELILDLYNEYAPIGMSVITRKNGYFDFYTSYQFELPMYDRLNFADVIELLEEKYNK